LGGGALSAAPALLQNGMDVLTSRLLSGWTIALGVAAAILAESRLGRRLVGVALAAAAVGFAVESVSTAELCGRLDAARAEAVAAATAAGPGATMIVFTPPRTAYPEPPIPDWGTVASLHRLFLGLDREVYHARDEASLLRASDPTRPGATLASTPGPLITAVGDYAAPDRALIHRCRTWPAYPAETPEVLPGVVDAAGVLRFTPPAGVPPRAYPTLRLELAAAANAGASGAAVEISFTVFVGAESFVRICEASVPAAGAHTVLLRPEIPVEFGAGGGAEIRAEARVRGGGARLSGGAWLRATPVFAEARPLPLTTSTPAAPPQFSVRNLTGLPYTVLVIEAALGETAFRREFVRATPAAGAAVEFGGGDGPAALLAAAAPALGGRPLALRARYEARARADGPAGAATETFVVRYAPR
jgi:hypothetical protein